MGVYCFVEARMSRLVFNLTGDVNGRRWDVFELHLFYLEEGGTAVGSGDIPVLRSPG